MNSHTSHTMHANSIAAYDSIDLNDRQRQVLGAYRDAGIPLTDREVQRRLGYAERNAVAPTITRLVQAGVLIEVGAIKDQETGRTVRICIAVGPRSGT